MAESMNKIRRGKNLETRDLWLLAIILIYGFYSGLFGDLLSYSINGRGFSNAARIEIDYGTKRRAFEGDVFSDMSVLDALLAASRGGSFEIRYALLGDKTDIMKIEDISEDGLDGQWHFYLNQKEVPADGIHKIKIKAGDRILAKFE